MQLLSTGANFFHAAPPHSSGLVVTRKRSKLQLCLGSNCKYACCFRPCKGKMQPISEAAQTAHTAPHAGAPWPDGAVGSNATRAHHLGHHRQCPCRPRGVLAALDSAPPSQQSTSGSGRTAMPHCSCPCPSPRLWDHHATMPRWSPRGMGKKTSALPLPCPWPPGWFRSGVWPAWGHWQGPSSPWQGDS